jgi:hypothetical protein
LLFCVVHLLLLCSYCLLSRSLPPSDLISHRNDVE